MPGGVGRGRAAPHYGSLQQPKNQAPAPPPKLDDDVARLLDEAEDIVNAAGFELMAEEARKKRKGMFRKRKKR
jgi:hypothetical protein